MRENRFRYIISETLPRCIFKSHMCVKSLIRLLHWDPNKWTSFYRQYTKHNVSWNKNGYIFTGTSMQSVPKISNTDIGTNLCSIVLKSFTFNWSFKCKVSLIPETEIKKKYSNLIHIQFWSSLCGISGSSLNFQSISRDVAKLNIDYRFTISWQNNFVLYLWPAHQDTFIRNILNLY